MISPPRWTEAHTSCLDSPTQPSTSIPYLAGGGTIIAHVAVVISLTLTGSGVNARSAPSMVNELVEVQLAPALEPATPPAPLEEIDQSKRVALPPSLKSPGSTQSRTEETPPPPPEAGQAGAVLTTDEEILDFGNQFVVGEGATFAGGITDAYGRKKKSVRDRNARAIASGGQALKSPSAVSKKKAASLAQSPRLSGGSHWNCPFPREAEYEQLDHAVVSLRIQVAANGRVRDVIVSSDPGHGFGREAKRCARRKSWSAGLDRNGKAVGATARVKVRFERR